MSDFGVYILDKDPALGEWAMNHLKQIGVHARWLPTLANLLAQSEIRPPTVCLVALRPPVNQALTLIRQLTQEPRFARTAFVLMGPLQNKHLAFEAGAHDYLITPPDVIELRKRVRLHLDRAELEARLIAETRISQEIQSLGEAALASASPEEPEPYTLLQHAADLAEERALLDLILNRAGEAIALVSPDGTLLYANPAWESLTQTSRQTALGQPIAWPPPAGQPETVRKIAAALENGTGWQGELRYAWSGGRTLDVAMTINPAFDIDQHLIGYVVTQVDIHDRRAEEEPKKQFFAAAANELRSPVTNIKMRQYLLREAAPDQREMHLQALERETERLSRMVDSMLELTRFDAGLEGMARDDIDLNRLAAETVIRFSPAAEAHGVTIALYPNETLPTLKGDATQLARALGALVENAIQYTPEAGHIEVRVDREGWTGGAFAVVRVRDTGIGILPEESPLIFDRFYRSVRARDRGTRGVGLGLSVAREIVTRHTGHITVESELDRGSTFSIWLPVS